MEKDKELECTESNSRRLASTKKNEKRTTVQLCGFDASSCGYCKERSFNSSVSYGMVSKSMMAEDYETLMLIGWSRSGKLDTVLPLSVLA